MFSENPKHNICFISMPFAPVEEPTLALPLLQSVLQDHGIASSILFANKIFAEECTKEIYDFIVMESTTKELGSWFFSRQTFQLDENNDYSEYLSCYFDKQNQKNLLGCRERFEKVILRLGNKKWDDFSLIGFTCSFTQIVPSLCLAKVIKNKCPGTEIIFGGGEMTPEAAKEVMLHCSWIDKVFIGDAEHSLPHYLKTGTTNIAGIMQRDSNGIQFTGEGRLKSETLRNLPDPIYDDFYTENEISKKGVAQVGRGCMYGKCTFCAFCDYKPYRKGSVRRVLSHIVNMVEKYDLQDISFCDLILPPNVFKQLPKIPGRYEMCISSFTFSYDHLPYLRNEKVIFGIESFHPKILDILNKKQSIINNISILKWLKNYEVSVEWHFLFGIIGEKGEWYDRMLDLVQHLTHLPPPKSAQPVMTIRTSILRRQFKHKPLTSYKHIYPECFNLDNIARNFELNDPKLIRNRIANWKHIHPVIEFMKYWKQKYLNSSLRRYDNIVIDERYEDPIRIHVNSNQIKILEKCERPMEEQVIANDYNASDIKCLTRTHLLLKMENKYLSLVEPDIF